MKLSIFLIALLAVVSTAHGQTKTVNDNDPSVVYSQGNAAYGAPIVNWFYYNTGNPEDIAGNEHSGDFQRTSGPNFQGGSVAVTFNGTAVNWIGKVGPNYGQASVSVDGVAQRTVDLYNPTEIAQHVNYSISGLTSGAHVLSISNLASKNAASSGYWQTVDAFHETGTSLPQSAGTVAGYKNPALEFGGSGWQCGSNLVDISGGHCWTLAADASLSWVFTGNLIEVFGRPDLENGYMKVYVDGSLLSTVDLHFGNIDDDSLNSVMLFAKRVPSGTHKIELVATGTHDSAATNSFIQIDEFAAFTDSGASGGGTPPLPVTYYFVDPGNLAWDAGWFNNSQWGDGPDIRTWTYASGNQNQQFVFTAEGQLQPAGTNQYLSDNAGVLIGGSAADTFTITEEGADEVTVKDNVTGLYVTAAGQGSPLHFSTSPYLWIFHH